MPTILYSPAQVTRAFLVGVGLGGYPQTMGAAIWPIYVANLPYDVDNAVVIHNTVGLIDGRIMRTGEVTEHPGIQLKVRSTDYEIGWAQAKAMTVAMDAALRAQVLMKDLSYRYVQNFNRKSNILELDEEIQSSLGARIETKNMQRGDVKRGRSFFVVNYNLTLGALGTMALPVPPTEFAPEDDVYGAINKDAVVLKMGTPVAVHSSGEGMVRAIADGIDHQCVGFLRDAPVEGVQVAHTGNVLVDGVLELLDWTDIVGVNTLTAHMLYFLDALIPGKLTTAPPTYDPAKEIFVQSIGVAVTPNKLEFDIQQPILLQG